MLLRRTPSQNKKNFHKQSFVDEANKMQLDKEDNQLSNLNSKLLSVTSIVFKYPELF